MERAPINTKLHNFEKNLKRAQRAGRVLASTHRRLARDQSTESPCSDPELSHSDDTLTPKTSKQFETRLQRYEARVWKAWKVTSRQVLDDTSYPPTQSLGRARMQALAEIAETVSLTEGRRLISESIRARITATNHNQGWRPDPFLLPQDLRAVQAELKSRSRGNVEGDLEGDPDRADSELRPISDEQVDCRPRKRQRTMDKNSIDNLDTPQDKDTRSDRSDSEMSVEHGRNASIADSGMTDSSLNFDVGAEDSFNLSIYRTPALTQTSNDDSSHLPESPVSSQHSNHHRLSSSEREEPITPMGPDPPMKMSKLLSPITEVPSDVIINDYTSPSPPHLWSTSIEKTLPPFQHQPVMGLQHPLPPRNDVMVPSAMSQTPTASVNVQLEAPSEASMVRNALQAPTASQANLPRNQEQTSKPSETNSEKSDLPSTDEQGALKTLEPGNWLSASALEFVLSACKGKGFRIHHGFSISTPEKFEPRASSRSDSADILLLTLYHHDHWTLAKLNVRDESIVFYDSLFSQFDLLAESALRVFVDRIGHNSKHWSFSVVHTPTQQNGDDCGAFVLITALHLLSESSLPSSYNVGMWRVILRALLVGEPQPCEPIVLPKVSTQPTSDSSSQALPHQPSLADLLNHEIQRTHDMSARMLQASANHQCCLKTARSLIADAEAAMKLLEVLHNHNRKLHSNLDAVCQRVQEELDKLGEMIAQYATFELIHNANILAQLRANQASSQTTLQVKQKALKDLDREGERLQAAMMTARNARSQGFSTQKEIQDLEAQAQLLLTTLSDAQIRMRQNIVVELDKSIPEQSP